MSFHQEGESTAPLDARVLELVVADRLKDAGDLLLTRLSPELRPFLHRLLGDVTLAEEAHSATCERLWRGLKTFRWECSLRSWSYIIARREASRCRARHALAEIQQTTLTVAERMPAKGTSRTSLSTTRRDILENLRESLSDEDRDLLVLRVERGLAWKEIAAAFLEEETSDPAAIDREAARLRQRYRSIRVGVKAALAKRKSESSPSEDR
jgi:RNA polymerase sigma-70 factor (ECF subfamily)